MGPTMTLNSIFTGFEKAATRLKSKKAITFYRNGSTETVRTYLQLHNDVLGFAAMLRVKGIRKGDRVILLMNKSLIGVTAHLAILYLGAVGVPLNPDFKKNELQYLFDDVDADLIILNPGKKALVEAIAPDTQQLEISNETPYQDLDLFDLEPASVPESMTDPNAPGLIIYTSGTTGNPKGAILTQRNLAHDAQSIISSWAMSETDVLCHALPLFHVHGLCFALHTALLSGAHLLMLDRFNPKIALDQLSRKSNADTCTIFMAVPAMYTKMMNAVKGHPLDLSHLRLATSGSAPLLADTFNRIHTTFGIEPVEREGMTETGMNFSNPLAGKRKPGSIGQPLPGVTVRIVDPNTHEDVQAGQVGEFWLRSPAITPGYWRKPAETQKAFDNGWFKTGDLGKIDCDGYYYLTDRIKHIIITGGENVSPVEVETVINQVDGVIESSVVGIADDKWGEKVVAAVVLAPDCKLNDHQIIAYCKTRLLNWKCPKKLVFLENLPRNTMGKVLKEEVIMQFNTMDASMT